MTKCTQPTSNVTIGEGTLKDGIPWHELTYLTTENEWATAKFFELENTGGAYAITASGVIVSLFWTTKAEGNPVERKSFPTADGYRMVDFAKMNEHRSSRQYVHRLVAQTLLKPPTEKKRTDVNHLDGDPSNNHLGNLSWLTRSENMNWNKAIKRLRQEKEALKDEHLADVQVSTQR